jgi:hypothetical protein
MNGEKKPGPNPWIAIVISIAAFLVSSTTLYFTHFYRSESVYMLFLHGLPGFSMIERLKGEDIVPEAINFNLGLANSGDQNVIISSLILVQPDEISIRALNSNDNSFLAPILLPPRAVQQLVVCFLLEGTPLRHAREGELSVLFKLSFITFGSSGKLQKSDVDIGFIITELDKSMFPPSPLTEPRLIRR